MNIFVLDQNPYAAAQYHCDKHVVKMILEYGQMLSTSHRLLDGTLQEWVVRHPETNKPKRLRHWVLPGEVCEPELQQMHTGGEDEDGVAEGLIKWVVKVENQKCYKVAHANHPCSVWARASDCNYHWLYQLFDGSLREYSRRYGKTHTAARIQDFLKLSPRRIPRSQLTPFAQAMPEEYKHDDPVEAYRRFYVGAKARFAKWKNSPVPDWFSRSMEGQDATDFARAA